MSTAELYDRLKKNPIIVATPAGLARVTAAGTNCHGEDIVRVRTIGVGSPATFYRHQVKVVEVR